MASSGDICFPLNQQHACAGTSHSHTYLLLILIHTSLRNYDRREASRDTWAGRKAFDDSVVILYFFSGNMESGNSQGHKYSLEKENSLHQDIVLTNFTHSDKFTSVLVPSTAWITKFCPHVSYVLNIIDNSIVDLDKLVLFLKSTYLKRQPLFMCDYLLPNESTVFNDFVKRDKTYCSTSAFLTTPLIMKELSSVLEENSVILKGAWLSEICDQASIPITTSRKLFTGSRRKPSMLKELMSATYPDSDVMIALVNSPIPGREAVIMRQAWHLIQSHHIEIEVNNQGQVPLNSSESGSILMFAVILMLIDFSVIFVIFTLIFCKRKRKLQL